MAKAIKGDYLSCAVCGLVVTVDEACGCASADVICCGKPMAAGKVAAKKAKMAAAKKPAKAATKKPAAKKPVRKAAAKKPTKGK